MSGFFCWPDRALLFRRVRVTNFGITPKNLSAFW
jgi:hypothetical protein